MLLSSEGLPRKGGVYSLSQRFPTLLGENFQASQLKLLPWQGQMPPPKPAVVSPAP